MTKTFNEKEIEKFSQIANQWWDPSGKFQILHKFNKPRASFIEKVINNNFDKESLAKLSALDIGCGGGIITESVYKLGITSIQGIDASTKTIEAAKIHAKKNNLNIDYQNVSYEDFVRNNTQKYNIVFAMEIIEHVDDQQSFINSVASLVEPNGLLFLSTINRTVSSLLLAKFAAEYVFNWVPKKTHTFDKFVTPDEMRKMLNKTNMEVTNISGISYNILNKSWTLSKSTNMNYICCAKNYN